jgi:hypothetical protein
VKLFITSLVILLLAAGCSEYSGEDLQFVERVADSQLQEEAQPVQAAASRNSSEVEVAESQQTIIRLCVTPFRNQTPLENLAYLEVLFMQSFENYLQDMNRVFEPIFILTEDYGQLKERFYQAGALPEVELISHIRTEMGADFTLTGIFDVRGEQVYFQPYIIDMASGEYLVDPVEPLIVNINSIFLEVNDYIGTVLNTIIDYRDSKEE